MQLDVFTVIIDISKNKKVVLNIMQKEIVSRTVVLNELKILF